MEFELPKTLSWSDFSEAILLRICSADYADKEPGFRASKAGRFDDREGKFETLYCAPDFETCYSETVIRDTGYSKELKRYQVSKKTHDSRCLSTIVADLKQLKLVDLFGDGVREMGLDRGVTLSSYTTEAGKLVKSYALTQALAAALYDHEDKPDGIVYVSRFGAQGRPAVVFFDRAKPHLRLFPGLAPTPFDQIHEAFDGLSKRHHIELI